MTLIEWLAANDARINEFEKSFVDGDGELWLEELEGEDFGELHSGDLASLGRVLLPYTCDGCSDIEVGEWFQDFVSGRDIVRISRESAIELVAEAREARAEILAEQEASRVRHDDFVKFCTAHELRFDSRAARDLFESDQTDEDWTEYERIAAITSHRHEQTDYDALLRQGYDRETAREMMQVV